MTTYLINQLALAGFNVINSRIDAYRFMKHKSVSHGVNFGAYALFCVVLSVIFRYSILQSALFLISAFFNRQLSFDILLNLRRRLPWYYQSTANPPEAILDRIERYVFGNAPAVGKKIARFYLICYLITIILGIWMY